MAFSICDLYYIPEPSLEWLTEKRFTQPGQNYPKEV
jgi:hypothetical protein